MIKSIGFWPYLEQLTVYLRLYRLLKTPLNTLVVYLLLFNFNLHENQQ